MKAEAKAEAKAKAKAEAEAKVGPGTRSRDAKSCVSALDVPELLVSVGIILQEIMTSQTPSR